VSVEIFLLPEAPKQSRDEAQLAAFLFVSEIVLVNKNHIFPFPHFLIRQTNKMIFYEG